MASVELADLTWQQAETVLTPDALVMIPLGAAAKEHGPHLRLDNDRVLAECLKDRVSRLTSVVVAPTLSYHHYPAFSDYPGSTSLGFETARDLLVDVVRSLAAHGPRRFYVLNTGLSTVGPLRAAGDILGASGILLRYTDMSTVGLVAEQAVKQQLRGSHADEIETSMMLHLAPQRVDMGKAVRDDKPSNGRGGFHRTSGGPGIFSVSGVWGDATLATAEKGRLIVEAVVEGIVRDIEELQDAAVD